MQCYTGTISKREKLQKEVRRMRAYSKYISIVTAGILAGFAMFSGELVLISLLSLNPVLVMYLVAGGAGAAAGVLTIIQQRLSGSRKKAGVR
jgi:hypothetical protein